MTHQIWSAFVTPPKPRTVIPRMKTNQFTKRWGAAAPRAKFTQLEIDEIRAAKNNGAKEADLANQYNVHRSTINRIVLGQSYAQAQPSESIFDKALQEVANQ